METQTLLSEISLIGDIINTKLTFTGKPVLSRYSKFDKIKFLMTNGSIMQVEHSAIILTCIKR